MTIISIILAVQGGACLGILLGINRVPISFRNGALMLGAVVGLGLSVGFTMLNMQTLGG